jgi:pimeloyl-ACP methyl ester carboxylesterase
MGSSPSFPPDRAHRLPDGRVLAFCEYGPPDGTPTFYFHGIPGSRIDIRVTAHAIADAGLRLIAPDRPGFGRSEPEAGKRSYAGWARDVEHLADALDLERFGIVAYSAGGPYAIGVAGALPDRVTRVAIVSGCAPSEMKSFRKGTGPTDRLLTRLSSRFPWLARGLVGRAVAAARKDPERFGRQMNRDFSAAPDQALLDEGLRAIAVELFLEATRSGPAGVVEDFAVWARPSGLAPHRISVPIHLWHGEADRTIPVSHSRWVASHVPSSELTVWPAVGHIHSEERWREVFKTLR